MRDPVFQSASVAALDVADRDALGHIETRVGTVGGVTTTSVYAYDAAGRLDTVTRNGSLVADYGYDANGNRLHEREDLAGSPIGVYDDQDRLLAYGSTSYTYSAGGDLESRTEGGATTTYAYDALGNLRGVTFPNGKKVEYVIDGQQRRVGKKVCAAPCTGGATAQPVQGLLYADGLRIAAELDAANQVGSVRLVVDAATGAIAQRIDYDEWGRITGDTSPGFQPFGFAGGLTDADTGLVRFGARDYDPQTGRWTAKDPIGFGGGDTNLYVYARNDPTNRIDPTGMYDSADEKFVAKCRAELPECTDACDPDGCDYAVSRCVARYAAGLAGIAAEGSPASEISTGVGIVQAVWEWIKGARE